MRLPQTLQKDEVMVLPVAMVSVLANLVILSSPWTNFSVSVLRRKLEANMEPVILRSSVQWHMNFEKRLVYGEMLGGGGRIDSIN